METIILEIRNAEGDEDTKLLAGDMIETYLKSTKQNNFNLSDNIGYEGFALLTIKENKGKKFYYNEIGTHLWKRVPPNEKRCQVQTSTVAVSIMDPESKFNYPIKLTDVTNLCVILHHRPTGIRIKLMDEINAKTKNLRGFYSDSCKSGFWWPISTTNNETSTRAHWSWYARGLTSKLSGKRFFCDGLFYQ